MNNIKTSKPIGYAFDIPPKRQPGTYVAPKKQAPRGSKAEQSCIALDTPDERAARLAKRVTDFHPMSMGTYPALSESAKSSARAKTANLKGKL